MTALAEADVARLESFKMPRPKTGAQLLFYPHASPTEDPEIAFALKVSHRSVLVQTASGATIDTVRHITDPKLQLNESQRESGAWDFPEDANLSERVATLEAKLAEVLELLDKPAKK